MMKQQWVMHKFGGTSLLNADRIENVYNILKNQYRLHQLGPDERCGIVVSAMKGTTDDLLNSVFLAEKNDSSYTQLIEKIKQRHFTEIDQLEKKSSSKIQSSLLKKIITNDIEQVLEILRGVWLLKSSTTSIQERISGLGEVWCAQILNNYLQALNLKSQYIDAREVLLIESKQQRIFVQWEESKKYTEDFFQKKPAQIYVITGFVAQNKEKQACTLGRNGSDFSGSIFAALTNSKELIIWTDVSGVLSADPRLVPEAIVLDEMSYSEMTELAYFGAKVVHPATMAPAISQKIPIWIKNSLIPTDVGSKIHEQAHTTRPVKAFTCIDKIALLNLEGPGMMGIMGVAERLFGALRMAQINIILISQASSEQSICLAIQETQAQDAQNAVNEAFQVEIQKKLLQQVQITHDVSILAAVGDAMAHTPGVSGQFFSALGRSSVNVRAIAQGSSERNISAVIDTKDAIRALRTVHSAFILPQESIKIGVVGVGLIGSSFLNQLDQKTLELKKERQIDIQVKALCNSKKMYLSDKPIDLSKWKELFNQNAVELDQQKFIQHLNPDHIPHAALIDATASTDWIPQYANILSQSIHIITPNKKANSSELSLYKEIRSSAAKNKKHFLYSTNVGAGLPIIQTLRDLISTGDEILKIQGVFSGTLSYIFNQFNEKTNFSDVVKLAKDHGFTEPDPRDDLSGQDVMRKLIILAREAGLQMEPEQVEVENLVPKEFQSITTQEFMDRLSELNAPMNEKLKSAIAKNQILRFVGEIDFGDKSQAPKAKVQLMSLDQTHAFEKLTGSDNIVLFKTKRYFKQNLVIQGPGAGPEVTAAGVFADLIRLSLYVGARS